MDTDDKFLYKDFEATPAQSVELHLPDGQVITADLDSRAAIGLLKIETADQIGDPDQQTWIINDTELDDDHTLSNYIPPGTIHTDENPLRIIVRIN